MTSSDDLKLILSKVNSNTFDNIIQLFITKLTDANKLFKPDKLGIQRFAIFYYSHLFMSPGTVYYNKKQTTRPTIQTRSNYLNYLINYTKLNKNSTINLLYTMLINNKNILQLRDSTYQKELFRINIDDEYFKYCIQHKLISFSSRTKTQSSSSTSLSSSNSAMRRRRY
jgi:hypothetical protein